MDFGRFSDDGREYIISRFPTPRPWENYLSNHEYGLRVDESGAGYSVLPCAPGLRISYASAGEPHSKVFYLRDRDSGRYWSLTHQPVGAPYDRFEVRHGLGYTVFEMSADGLESSLRVFVPLEDQVEIWSICLRNLGETPRRLDLFPYVEWHLAPSLKPWDNYRNYIEAHWSAEERLVVGRLADPARPGEFFSAFAAVDPPAGGYDTDRETFLGGGSLAAPSAVVEGACRNSDMPGDGRAIAAFAVPVDLKSGQERVVTFLVGYANEPDRRRELVETYLSRERADAAFGRLNDRWEALSRQPMVQTPSPEVDRMVNFWLKANVQQLSRVIREGLRGYRDTLQDAMGIVSFEPEMARARIVEALHYQYADGRAIRQFAYNGAPHDLRIYNDSPLWLVLSTARYLRETGDFALLDELIPFFESAETGTILEHLSRAIDWIDGLRGHHDLIRIDRGDWCDALDEVGIRGQGVSIWLSQAFHLALLELADIYRMRGDKAGAERALDRAKALAQSLERHAWDGAWYICAVSDSGKRLGVSGDAAMEIYLNSQSWAAIGRAGAQERLEKALDMADEKLESDFGPLLLDPPYYAYDPDVGRLTVLRPGCGENGTVYVHAAVFYFLANLMARRPDRALEVLRKIAPMMEAQDPTVTFAAPYAYVNSYVGPCYPAHAGRSLTNWYTSSASWTLFAVTDWLLGVRPTFEGLLIDPCLPSEWERASLRRSWRGAEYEVTITKPRGIVGTTVSIEVDGEALSGAVVPAFGDGRRHRVAVRVS